jgi:class 3 adenylate cyclase
MIGSKTDYTPNWSPQPPELLALMRPTKPWSIQMERYNRGIDNKSIDVHLSPKFVANVQRVIHGMIQQDVTNNYWGKTNKPVLSTAELEQFRGSYESLMDAAMQPRDNPAAVDWTRLVQLAVFKFFIQSISIELQELRQRLETSRDDAHASGNRLQYHQRLTTLAMEGGAIYYRVCKRLFGIIERIEATRLRRLRKSRLGVSWPVPHEALFNILLQLRNLLNEEMGMYHYPMLLLSENGKKNRSNLNRCIIEVFKHYLPIWIQDKSGIESTSTDDDVGDSSISIRVMNRLDQGNLRGFMETEIVLSQFLTEVEYKQPQYSWLDEPSNLIRLLSLSSQNQEKSSLAPEFQDEDTAKRWRHFARVIRDDLFQRMEALNITSDIITSYWAAKVCQSLPPTTSPRLIYEFLSGQQDRQRVLRKLASTGSQQEQDISVITKALDSAMIEIKQLTPEHKRKFFGRVLIDFLTLRRDLKLAYKTFEAMDQISILLDERNLALSRANNLLHEFLLADEQQGENRISCHAILKADLRGSTKITNELRAKKLNPATHFSQNFFNPINALLEDFGAKKVFVEGDAVILSILENTGNAKGGLIVAWACGLGTEILNVVARQNLINRRYGLPDLELGLGIAFVNEEPTFLHDGDHPIMISPAINLADRLSSCAKALRNADFAQTQRPFRVEVLLPPEGSDATAGAKTDVLRYNVNGIEIDEAAFNHLKIEIALRPLYVKIAGQTETLHVGRYPDRSDRMRWLVVRESPLHVWEWGQISKHPAPGKRTFYEVIVDQDLVDKVRAKLGGREERLTQETSNPETSDNGA